MTKLPDHFSMDIVLRHPSYTPEAISKAPSIKPRSSWTAGQNLGARHAKWTYFHACLQEGNRSSNYENALAKVVAFLEKNATFWTDFMNGQGEVELILNHTLLEHAKQGDLCLEVHLEPVFLEHLSSRRIRLRVQGWKGPLQ
jgi:hypothetical protein